MEAQATRRQRVLVTKKPMAWHGGMGTEAEDGAGHKQRGMQEHRHGVKAEGEGIKGES